MPALPTDRLNAEFLAFSDGYADTMETIVLPYLNARRRDHTVAGQGGKPLACATFQADEPRGTVIIVHGFTENAYKFSEIIFSLLHQGYSVLAYDQRGHGNSWRKEGIKDPSATHVDRFDEYVMDLKCVTDDLLPGCPRPWMVFCHSMGGAVTALFLEWYPTVFDRAVMCAPMIAPNIGRIPKRVARAVSRGANAVRRVDQRVFFLKPYQGPEDFASSCTTDPNRFAWYDAVKAATPAYQNASPSYAWSRESISVTDIILAPGAPEKIACPVLLFTAELDTSVLPKPQKAFIDRVPKGTHVFVPGAKHEIYRCADDVLFPWWRQVLAFLAESAS